MSYLHAKAYDVISSGQFKKHLAKCRDNGDSWAVSMYSMQTRVLQVCKELNQAVSHLNTTGGAQVYQICRDVMTCAQPPVKILTGRNVCSITGVQTDYCVDLTKMGKSTREVFVHPRFWHFFIFLWYCAKLEYVIRSYTKHWLELKSLKPDQGSYTALCEDFSTDNKEFCKDLYALFIKAFDYVTRSLQEHKKLTDVQPVLRPPAGFFCDSVE